MEEIKKKRCDDDPIYNALFHPEVDDFLNELIKTGIAITNKKYGERFRSDRCIQHMHKLLTTAINDPIIKQMVVTFFLVWEPLLTKEVAKLYGKDSLFGNAGVDHYNKFIIKMEEYIKKTLLFPCNESNIIQLVENYTNSTKKEYWMSL
jgi:hypothetical protein